VLTISALPSVQQIFDTTVPGLPRDTCLRPAWWTGSTLALLEANARAARDVVCWIEYTAESPSVAL
jgi:hypothetical protein